MAVTSEILARYNIKLTPEEENAIHYAHGEGSDHRKDQRVAGPLAAHVHHCDNTSARIWYDEGKGLSPYRGTMEAGRACVRCGAPMDDYLARRTRCDLCREETA